MYSLIRSSWDFFGMISSMCGASKGYVSSTFVRIARCTEDLTFDLAPAVILDFMSMKSVRKDRVLEYTRKFGTWK